MFHTVYNSFESTENGRDYIGKHSSEDPYDDYLGSYKDESFDPDAKIILAYAKTPQGAVWLEERFQKVFGVVTNPQFVNRSYQTGNGFDTTGVKEGEEAKRKRVQKVSEFYATPEGFETASIKTKGTTWYHLPDGTERRFISNPGQPWIEGRNDSLGDKVRHNLNPSSGGKTAGKLPWWYNPLTEERRRSFESPGENWEPRKGPNKTRTGVKPN